MSDDENFYQYHNADDKKGYATVSGEEVAHNLLGGRDPSLVDGCRWVVRPSHIQNFGEHYSLDIMRQLRAGSVRKYF